MFFGFIANAYLSEMLDKLFLGNDINIKDLKFFSSLKNLLQINLRNCSLQQIYSYDEDLNLTELKILNNRKLVVDNFYCYDRNGNRVAKNELNDNFAKYIYNENIPLRFLLYIAREYEKILNNKNMYKTKLVKIPKPEFIVLYNVESKYSKNSKVYLSDAFGVKENLNLELVVKVININYEDHNILGCFLKVKND